MPKVPRVSGREAVAAFEKAGFVHVKTKGSHYILTKDGRRHAISIPVHRGKTVGTGLLSSQIAHAGLTVEEFIEFL